ncbi:MAG TPA: hypothetical protein VHJ78_00610 [Actinomycetota bacterium]|nr:hypothetical protein [Actinomycetota bacterium]
MTVLRSLRPLLLILVILSLPACGGAEGEPVSVTAREYAFQGLPTALEAGPFEFSIANQGEEAHELHIFKLADDVGSIADLQGKSQDEAMDVLTTVGMAVANPGDEQSFDAELEAGRYAAVCLIPVGTKQADAHAGHNAEEMEDIVFDPNADTHFRRGMYSEFSVS